MRYSLCLVASPDRDCSGQAELAAHVTAESAVEVAASVAGLQEAAHAAGLESSGTAWPSGSAICLLAFCKGVGRGEGSRIAYGYTGAAALLSSMAAPEVFLSGFPCCGS